MAHPLDGNIFPVFLITQSDLQMFAVFNLMSVWIEIAVKTNNTCNLFSFTMQRNLAGIYLLQA